MKKIALLLTLSASLFATGCTETDYAIIDYCNWEDYCGFRSYSECSDTYYDYTYRAPGCDGAIIDMADAYNGLTCGAYKDYATNVDPCWYWYENGYYSERECLAAMERVYIADNNLRHCLFSYGVNFYGI